MKKILLTLSLACIAYASQAQQNYKTGIGLRLGGLNSGITVRHFVNSNSALEGILGFGHKHFLVTGLYEKQQPINNAPGLGWYYGGGAHVGFFSYGGYYRWYDNGHYYVEYPGENEAVFGLDFILGLDYKFSNAPVNIGLDIKPFVDFFDGASGYWDGALSFRFVF